MESYGVLPYRKDVVSTRVKHVFKIGVVFFIVATIGWVGALYFMNINHPYWVVLVGAFILWGMFAFSLLYELRKVKGESIGELLNAGEENAAFTATMKKSLERNGCISIFDLKVIRYEIWVRNSDLKSSLNNPKNQDDPELLMLWGEYRYNENLIKIIENLI